MNKMKKALLGTVLAGAVVVGASAGTYAWFNAQYTVGGEITNHTLTLGNGGDKTGTEVYEALDFGNTLLAPSKKVSDSFIIQNTGSLNQRVQASFDLALYDGNTNVGEPDKSEYTIYATVHYNGHKIIDNISGNAEQIDDALSNMWLPENGIGPFKPEDKVKVDLTVELNKTAGNDYQGKTLKGGLTVKATQMENVDFE